MIYPDGVWHHSSTLQLERIIQSHLIGEQEAHLSTLQARGYYGEVNPEGLNQRHSRHGLRNPSRVGERIGRDPRQPTGPGNPRLRAATPLG